MPEDNSVTTHSLADLSQTMTVEPGISPCGDVHVNAKPWQELPRKIKPVITPGNTQQSMRWLNPLTSGLRWG